jgi:hypothetical protein
VTNYSNRLELARALFSGEGAELGVAGGKYSDEILRHCPAVTLLWSIDRWSDHHNVLEYWSAANRLAVHGERSRVRRCTFTEAAQMIPDGSLAWCYIDGYAHSGQDGGQTLEEWWPKLRPGGIMAGHDYHPDWPATVQAVDAFAARHGLQFGRTQEYVKEREWPSWWVRKP